MVTSDAIQGHCVVIELVLADEQKIINYLYEHVYSYNWGRGRGEYRMGWHRSDEEEIAGWHRSDEEEIAIERGGDPFLPPMVTEPY